MAETYVRRWRVAHPSLGCPVLARLGRGAAAELEFGGSVAHAFSFPRCPLRFNFDYSFNAGCPMTKAAPRPVFGRSRQSPLDRVAIPKACWNDTTWRDPTQAELGWGTRFLHPLWGGSGRFRVGHPGYTITTWPDSVRLRPRRFARYNAASAAASNSFASSPNIGV